MENGLDCTLTLMPLALITIALKLAQNIFALNFNHLHHVKSYTIHRVYIIYKDKTPHSFCTMNDIFH